MHCLCNLTYSKTHSNSVHIKFQVMGQVEKFESAVKLVIDYAKFDSDIIVSVFETNIRVLG